MAAINKIKNELCFCSDLRQLLDIMKDIAVFQYHILQQKEQRFNEFASLIEKFFYFFDGSQFKHPFVTPKSAKSYVVIITSDEGFMGNLNLKVINIALNRSKDWDSEIIIVGEKGKNYLKEIGREAITFKNITNFDQRFKLAFELKNFVFSKVVEEGIGRVVVFYPKSVSFMVQKVEEMWILPLSILADLNAEDKKKKSVIIESPAAGIIEFLAQAIAFQKFIEVLEEGKLSEFAARAIHLEDSQQELWRREKSFRFKYFRAHHAGIDKTTRELFSSQIIRKNKNKKKLRDMNYES